MQRARTTDARAFCADLIDQALAVAFPGTAVPALPLERPKNARHGGYASNAAMQLARTLKRSPRDIANAIVAALPQSEYLDKAEIAGAGFINLFLKLAFKQAVVKEALANAASFGRHEIGKGRSVQVEFV